MLSVEGLFQIGFEKLFELSERYFSGNVIVQVHMICTGDNHKLFVFTADRLISIFGKIA
ncbi:Uncharacterised protein [Serratia marcescens]|uniref:Uncharacterized protein n=1 Tax=Serratia marcescens TaxID=615 RepID=A0A379Z3M6_SERMA|nr:Uncharacterised protein [Serratia marcescens]